jgi:glutamate racemase
MLCAIGIFGTIVVLATCITLLLRTYYRRIIKKKNEGLVHFIIKQNQLQKKVETMEIEKRVMERMLGRRGEGAKARRHESTKARKHESTKQLIINH